MTAKRARPAGERKVEKIDWSAAGPKVIGAFVPIGAVTLGREPFFVVSKEAKGGVGFTGLKSNNRGYHVYSAYWQYVERPLAWNGEGLPPVGTVCEAYWPRDTKPKWMSFELLFMGKELCVARVDGKELDYRVGDFEEKSVSFRPIRTPEHIAEEALEKELNEIERLYTEGGPTAVYDAGYRKIEGGSK